MAKLDESEELAGTAPATRPPGNFQVSLRAGCEDGSPMAELTWTPSSGADRYLVYLNGLQFEETTGRVSRFDLSAFRGQSVLLYVQAVNEAGVRTGEEKMWDVPAVCPPSDSEIQERVDRQFPGAGEARDMWNALWVAFATVAHTTLDLPVLVEAAFSKWLETYVVPERVVDRRKRSMFRTIKFPDGKLPKEDRQ